MKAERTRRAAPGAWLGAAGLAALLLAGCDQSGDLDWDLRRTGFSTADAARAATGARPQPDSRGVISYPQYQVAVARPGESVQAMAGRLGIGAAALARQNALSVDSVLRGGELLVLPERVAAGVGGGDGAGTIAVTPLGPAAPAAAAAPAAMAGPEPVRHTVQRGETAFSIARLYNLPVRTIAEWNGLPADMAVREGQVLIVPAPQTITQAAAPAPVGPGPSMPPVQVPATVAPSASAPAPLPPPVVTPTTPPPPAAQASAGTGTGTSAPGQGTATPPPPSASQPLPQTNPAPAGTAPTTPPVADMAGQRTQRASLAMPVQGRVIRAYQRGRNDGIGIGAPAGAEVRAAAAGTVAAITRDTEQVPILVIRHENNLLTVYANLDNIRVERGARVTRGQTIATVRRGDPSFLHFEVREGLESVDPMPYLQ